LEDAECAEFCICCARLSCCLTSLSRRGSDLGDVIAADPGSIFTTLLPCLWLIPWGMLDNRRYRRRRRARRSKARWLGGLCLFPSPGLPFHRDRGNLSAVGPGRTAVPAALFAILIFGGWLAVAELRCVGRWQARLKTRYKSGMSGTDVVHRRSGNLPSLQGGPPIWIGWRWISSVCLFRKLVDAGTDGFPRVFRGRPRLIAVLATGRTDARDTCGCSGAALAGGVRYLLHDGRLDPHPADRRLVVILIRFMQGRRI
jgi:hypothetical protein